MTRIPSQADIDALRASDFTGSDFEAQDHIIARDEAMSQIKDNVPLSWKPLIDVYPEPDWRGYFSEYDPLLASFGYEIVLKVDDDDYQGDSRILYRDGQRFGILTFGWGSCSGCDALQACDNLEEVEELRADLHSQIKWFASPSEALHYINTHDWEGDYCWNQAETHKFISDAKILLAAREERQP